VNAWQVRSLLDLHGLLNEFPSLRRNHSLEILLKLTAEAWRSDIRFAANFTAVRKSTGDGLYFLHPCVGSDCTSYPHKPQNLQPGGVDSDCVERGTCFPADSMTAKYSDYMSNYANFRIFSETLQAGILDADYEKAIMSYREAHRGTMVGMTRFRSHLDDMPILGYGWGDLSHDRLGSFHTLLAGHSANYLSRGTFWGTEQREHLGLVDNRERNPGVGGEYGSLCMVSSIPVAYWIRWMLLQENLDEDVLYIARGAPERWYESGEQFGIDSAPTRFGRVSFNMTGSASETSGSVVLSANPGSEIRRVRLSIRVRAGAPNTLIGVTVEGGVLVSLHPENNTAFIDPQQDTLRFRASFANVSLIV